MNPISMYFFALTSILGMESTGIVSQEAIVTINPVEKTFEIRQKNLFSIIMTTEDSLMVANELQQILEFQENSDKKTIAGLTIDEIVLSRNGEQLNATLKGSYTAPAILVEAGIDLDTTNNTFSLINIPEWNMNSSDAVLKENFWFWSGDKPVTIVMKPFENIPDEYLKNLQSILPYWERWLRCQPRPEVN